MRGKDPLCQRSCLGHLHLDWMLQTFAAFPAEHLHTTFHGALDWGFTFLTFLLWWKDPCRPCLHVLYTYALKCHLETRIWAADRLCPLLLVTYNGAWLCPWRGSVHTAVVGVRDLLCLPYLVICIGAWWGPRHLCICKWRNRATDPSSPEPLVIYIGGWWCPRLYNVCAVFNRALRPRPLVINWGLVVPMALHSIHLVQLGNRPLASVAPGDVHWGLVVPDALQCTLVVVLMALHPIHLVQLGNGPLVRGPLVMYIGTQIAPKDSEMAG